MSYSHSNEEMKINSDEYNYKLKVLEKNKHLTYSMVRYFFSNGCK